MTQWLSKAISVSILSGLVIAAACSGSAPPESKDAGSSRSAPAPDAAGEKSDADRLLGKVDLAAPRWLPENFPLPDDRRIYTDTDVGSVPPGHQLQARTMATQDDLHDAFIQWGAESNIEVKEVSSRNNILVFSISGGGFGGASSVQIIEDARGVRRIILTLQDEN